MRSSKKSTKNQEKKPEESDNSKKEKKVRKTRKDSKEPLLVNCWICDFPFKVKYVFAKQKYSDKNNWGYWTEKATDKKKYFCNVCLWKLHVGKMSDWIENESRADVFYNYIKKGQFGKKSF